MWRKWRVVWWLLAGVMGVLFVLPTSPAEACEPGPGDWWFEEVVAIDQSFLPEGVDVEAEVALSGRSRDYQLRVRFDNRLEEGIYILPTTTIMGLSEAEKFVQGYQLPDRLLQLGRLLEPGFSTTLNAVTNRQNHLLKNFSFPEPIHVNIRGDRRTGEPPAPQSFMMALAINDRLVPVPMTILYSDNRSYDPHSGLKEAEACHIEVEEEMRLELERMEREAELARSQAPALEEILTDIEGDDGLGDDLGEGEMVERPFIPVLIIVAGVLAGLFVWGVGMMRGRP